MMRSIVFILFCISLLTSFSCKKNIDDNSNRAPLVNGSFNYHRIVTYAATLPSKELLITNRGDTNVVAVLNEKNLLISFYTKPFSDDIIFAVPINDLASEMVGTYKIKAKNAVDGVTNTEYIFNFYKLQNLQHSFIILASEFNGNGNLTITAYDQQQNTIAGTFQLSLETVSDPTVDIIDQGYIVTPNCNIKIEGSFKNIQLHN